MRIENAPHNHILIEKSGTPLQIDQLSLGERSLIGIVGSIAIRLSMSNPTLKNPLEGQGNIIIDALELHLHPKLQGGLIASLCSTFPNCQFILSTNSPLVLSGFPDMQVFMLNAGAAHPLGNMYGMDANQILLQEMGVSIRNQEIQDKLDDIQGLIHDRMFSKAYDEINELEKEISGDHWELNKIKILLMRKEAQFAEKI